MRELRELQQAIAQAIVSGQSDGRLEAVVSTGALSARDRLQLYTTSFRSRTAATLRSVFPLTAIATADGFDRLVAGHLDRWRGGDESQLLAAFVEFLADSGREAPDPALRSWAAFVTGIARDELSTFRTQRSHGRNVAGCEEGERA
jgi:hypothetical protein